MQTYSRDVSGGTLIPSANPMQNQQSKQSLSLYILFTALPYSNLRLDTKQGYGGHL